MFQSTFVSRLWLVVILLAGAVELQAQKEAVCYKLRIEFPVTIKG